MNSKSIIQHKLTEFEQQYRSALHKHLGQNSQWSAYKRQVSWGVNVVLGIKTLELSRIHERALVLDGSAITQNEMIEQSVFFDEAITPLEENHSTTQKLNARLSQLNKELHQRKVDLKILKQQLKQEVIQRKQMARDFKKNELRYANLQEQSSHMQEQLHTLSHKFMSAQEEERKRISRELHDEIAQTLTCINVQLAVLKKESAINVKGIQKKITCVQKMVEKSVEIVHFFACKLRSPVLDDLGLIPALRSFLKQFMKQNGIRARLMVCNEVEQLDNTKRTVLFRVAQESLTNVFHHAKATRVYVGISKLPDAVRMVIKDNGKASPLEQPLLTEGIKHLGLIGMRERVEMVGGIFSVKFTKDKGTIVRTTIPFATANNNYGANKLKKPQSY